MIGSVNSGRPVSQHLEFGGPEAAEHGDELRAGTDVVTAMGADAGGGVGGVVDTEVCKGRKRIELISILGQRDNTSSQELLLKALRSYLCRECDKPTTIKTWCPILSTDRSTWWRACALFARVRHSRSSLVSI